MGTPKVQHEKLPFVHVQNEFVQQLELLSMVNLNACLQRLKMISNAHKVSNAKPSCLWEQCSQQVALGPSPYALLPAPDTQKPPSFPSPEEWEDW